MYILLVSLMGILLSRIRDKANADDLRGVIFTRLDAVVDVLNPFSERKVHYVGEVEVDDSCEGKRVGNLVSGRCGFFDDLDGFFGVGYIDVNNHGVLFVRSDVHVAMTTPSVPTADSAGHVLVFRPLHDLSSRVLDRENGVSTLDSDYLRDVAEPFEILLHQTISFQNVVWFI